MSVMQLLRTVRHLRGRQIVGQIAHRLRRAVEDPALLRTLPVPAYPGCAWQPRKPFLAPRHGSPDDIRAGRFTFLNRAVELGWPPDWDCVYLPKLWQYNLHYFDYLWALPFDGVRALAIDWIEHHSPARGRSGWDSYPMSLRLMNWCAVYFSRFRAETEQDITARNRVWQSIYRQCEWLRRHLETHLMGNHLLENAAALVVAGSCFDGDAARVWYRAGIALLREQLAEQVLADGGHFERSPMYHSRVVYVLAMLSNIGRDDLSRVVDDPLRRAVEAMKHMCHPDGRIALLNDSALNIYNEPAELAEFIGAPGPAPAGNFALPDTGYFGARADDGSYVICDAGPIGPDYLPGHAHGDMLSFELSLRGHRVITDSGVYDYTASPQRDYCRSTAAHNTIEVNGQSQCEFWDVFRVARRGTVHDVKFTPRDDGFELRAWHDGYQRLAGRVRHQRTFDWTHRGGLAIEDVVTCSSPVTIASRFHLHPDCRVVAHSSSLARVEHPAGEFTMRFDGIGPIAVHQSVYFPEFGRELVRPMIQCGQRVRGSARFGVTIAQTT